MAKLKLMIDDDYDDPQLPKYRGPLDVMSKIPFPAEHKD
jgi:hypothetical protein